VSAYVNYRRTISVLACFLVATAGIASVGVASAGGPISGERQWVSRYEGGGSGADSGEAVAASPDGTRVFVTGSAAETTGLFDYATVAYEAVDGSQLWASTYNGTGNLTDDAHALAVSPDGTRVFVTGESIGSSAVADYATVAYDAASGAQLWVRRYNGPGNSYDFAYSVGTSPDGYLVYVTGTSVGAASTDFATIAYVAATGAPVWLRRSKGSDGRYPAKLALTPDGSNVVVAGTAGGAADDYVTFAYDAGTGVPIWARRFNGKGNGDDVASALAISANGARVFVTGTSPDGVSNAFATVAYDVATSQGLWVKYLSPGNYDAAYDIAVSPDNTKVFVTGSVQANAFDYNFGTIAYDQLTGAPAWVRYYNGPAGSTDNAFALAVSPDGTKVFVTGPSVGLGTLADYATLAYDSATGIPLWNNRYNGPDNGTDQSFDVAVSAEGTSVLVTGESGSTNADYATLSIAV
jgi:WD40 repeat protein